MLAIRLFRFYRSCGVPRWVAIKKAVNKALQS